MNSIYSKEQNNIIIVTHGGTLGYIVAWWLGYEAHMLSHSYFSASVGSISRLKLNHMGQHCLHVFNDTSHL